MLKNTKVRAVALVRVVIAAIASLAGAWRARARQVARTATTGLAWLFPQFGPEDVHLWLGVALLAIGLEQVYHPLIWIAPGALFTILAWPKSPPPPVARGPHIED